MAGRTFCPVSQDWLWCHIDEVSALLPLWPTGLSYAVSYLFIAIIWTNHHRLLLFAHEATPKLIWWNFAHLFMTSLIPFSTAWIADTRLEAGPVLVYAAVFAMVRSEE